MATDVPQCLQMVHGDSGWCLTRFNVHVTCLYLRNQDCLRQIARLCIKTSNQSEQSCITRQLPVNCSMPYFSCRLTFVLFCWRCLWRKALKYLSRLQTNCKLKHNKTEKGSTLCNLFVFHVSRDVHVKSRGCMNKIILTRRAELYCKAAASEL